MDEKHRILQVSTSDIAGGAEKIARDLFHEYRKRGHCSWLAVGNKKSNEKDVLVISNENTRGIKYCNFLQDKIKPFSGRIPGAGSLYHFLDMIFRPGRSIDILKGREDFNFSGTGDLASLAPGPPELIHCHNLHGGYFDLTALPELCDQVPVILTLHDAWLLSGHCAHSFECELWKTGCGNCPDLTIPPAIRKDATAYNWKRKKDIYSNSRFHVTTPCQWLMDRVMQSILVPSIIKARVIPNGVDTNLFHTYARDKARKELGLPQDASILLFTANGIRQNIWKDYKTLKEAVSRVAGNGKNILFLALGENAPPEKAGYAEVNFLPYQNDPGKVARYYQAADIYIHAARIDTFPTTVLEALACGTPVVATDVGGIPEQVEDGLTGFLVPPKDAVTMASRIELLLSDSQLRKKMGDRAAEIVKDRFSLERQVKEYLDFYEEILGPVSD